MSLTTRIVLTALAPLFGVALFMMLRLESLRDFQEEQIARRLENKTHALRHDLEEHLAECARMAAILAGLDEVPRGIYVRDADVLHARGRLFTNREGLLVLFIGKDGRVVARGDDEDGSADRLRGPEIDKAVQGVAVSGLLRLYGGWYLCALAPVVRFRDEPVGCVLYAEPLDSVLLGSLTEEHRLALTAEVDGHIVGRTADDVIAPEVNRLELVWSPDGTPDRRVVIHGYADYRNEKTAVSSLRANLMFSLLLAILALGIGGHYLLKRISRPVDILSSGLNDYAIGRQDFGNLAALLAPYCSRQDELGHLARGFSAMAARIREKQFEAQAAIREKQDYAASLAESNTRLEGLVLARTADLAAARDQAEAANRAKTEFLAGVSHEIRTPLNAIIGLADLMSEADSATDRAEFTRMIKSSGQTLLTLISDVLDLARVESGKLTLSRSDFALREIIFQAKEMFALKAGEKGLTLRTRIAEDVPPRLLGDGPRLLQVLVNLLGNSVKFTAQGEIELDVRVNATPTSRSVVLRFAVKDTGIGIAPGDLERIFESFTQADSSTTRTYGGFGLGLTISRRLVELMDGRMQVESVPGQGSTFSFTASFAISEATVMSAPAEHVSAPRPPASVGGQIRILAAEDALDNRRLLELYMRNTGYRLDMALNGQQAVDMFRTGGYDLVLMDMQMPVMDGYTATREIRTYEAATGATPVPIVALTAHALAEDEKRCLEAGCTAYLSKPIRKDRLLSCIAAYVGPADNGAKAG